MSKISKEGYEQIKVIRNALDSMFDKLDRTLYVQIGKKSKNIDGGYKSVNVFDSVKSEFEAIAGIIEKASDWEEAEVDSDAK